MSAGNGFRKVSATVEGTRIGRFQSNLRLNTDHRLGINGEPIPLSHRRKDNRCFYRRECASNAHPLSTAERIVRKLGNALCEPIFPAFRAKFFRFGKILGVAVIHPLAHQNRVASLHAIAAKFKVGVASRPITYTGGNKRMDSAITAAV